LDHRNIRAAIIARVGVEVRQISPPKLEKGAVLVEMKSSGICGTDLEKLTGGYTASTILGHEVSAVVSESESDMFVSGESVVPHHHVACGSCYLCRNGAETMCNGFRNSNFEPGGFADFFRVPEYNVSRGGVHKFSSSSLSFDDASFVEPLGCCIRGLEKALHLKLRKDSSGDDTVRGRIPPINSALVVGAGPIGLLHMELLRSKFPELDLVTVDVIDSRLQFAEKFVQARTLRTDKSDGSFSEKTRSLVRTPGFDLVVVATGSSKAFAESVKCVRKSGALLLFGAPARGSTYLMDLQSMLLSEISFSTSYATTEREISDALWLLEQKKINVSKFVTSRFPLDRIREAMQVARSEGQVKVIITR
jgi:L-iditol 2-dehydrogenase